MSDFPVSADVAAGQAVYSRTVLAAYDLLVLGLSNRWIWRCPTPHLLDWYERHARTRHLDVGVGTGYFLDRCRFPETPQVALVDLNQNSLDATARRIARFKPTCYRRNVLEPLALPEAPFDSVGMNYLLHCVPGALPAKARAFDHASEYLEPGGVLFGATLLQHGVNRNRAARALMHAYNRRGIFSNAADRLSDLRDELDARFHDVEIQVHGCAALFAARKPSSSGPGVPDRDRST